MATLFIFAFSFSAMAALANFFVFLVERKNGDEVDRKLRRLEDHERPVIRQENGKPLMFLTLDGSYTMPCRPISRFA
jgi:hypothetical protein